MLLRVKLFSSSDRTADWAGTTIGSVGLIDDGAAARFAADGFVVVADGLIDPALIEPLRARFEALFAGDFETGTPPDEVNWQRQTGDPSLTRQICNAWKADRTVASAVLGEVRRAKSEARRPLRTPVVRAVVTDTGDRLAVLGEVADDVRAAGRIRELATAAGSAFGVESELEQP